MKRGYRRKYAVGGRGLFDTVANLAGRIFTSSAAKTLGSKAMSAATNAALKGVEKGAAKAVDHVVDKVTRKVQKPRKPNIPSNPSIPAMTSQQQARLNNLIPGGGIATIHDFVRRYK